MAKIDPELDNDVRALPNININRLSESSKNLLEENIEKNGSQITTLTETEIELRGNQSKRQVVFMTLM